MDVSTHLYQHTNTHVVIRILNKPAAHNETDGLSIAARSRKGVIFEDSAH